MEKDKLVCCDLDGTLIQTDYCVYQSYNEALLKFEKKQEFSLDYYLKECKGLPYNKFLPNILIDNNLMEEVHELKKNCYPKYRDSLILNEFLYNFLTLVRPDSYLALVTTATRKNTEEALEIFNNKFDNFFDLIICQEDVKLKKPHPEAYLRAIHYFKVQPERTIIFEDSLAGFEAGKAAGGLVFLI